MVNVQRWCRQRTEERGSSLLELLIALSIFGIFVVGLAPVMFSTMDLARNNKSRSVAANLASAQMDTLRSTAFASLDVGRLVVKPAPVDGTQYTITQDSEWVDPGANTSVCSGGTTARPRFLRFTLSVAWTNMKGTKPVQSQTIITPPVSTYDPYTGAIRFQVADATGKPVQDVPVTVTGTSAGTSPADTANTTTEGCVFMPYLKAGSYNVSLNSPSFVDPDGSHSVVRPLSVTTGQLTSPGAQPWDKPANIQAAIVTPSGGLVPDVSVTAFNTGLTGFRRVFVAPGSGQTSRNLADLFPFESGYNLYPGDCADSDPEGTTTGGAALYPGATRATAIATLPTKTSTALVTMPEVPVTVTSGGAPATPTKITATHLSGSSPSAVGCTTSGLLTYSAAPAGSFAIGLPLGKWRVKVEIGAASRTVDVTVVPGTPNPPIAFAF